MNENEFHVALHQFSWCWTPSVSFLDAEPTKQTKKLTTFPWSVYVMMCITCDACSSGGANDLTLLNTYVWWVVGVGRGVGTPPEGMARPEHEGWILLMRHERRTRLSGTFPWLITAVQPRTSHCGARNYGICCLAGCVCWDWGRLSR